MTSLEIVNNKIKWLKDNLEKDKIKINEIEDDMNLFEYNPLHEHLNNNIELYEHYLNFLEPIKKDLEILQLIKKNYKVHLEIVVDKMSDDMIKIDHYLSNKVGDNL